MPINNLPPHLNKFLQEEKASVHQRAVPVKGHGVAMIQKFRAEKLAIRAEILAKHSG